MGLAQDQDIVEAFSPDRADESFDVSIAKVSELQLYDRGYPSPGKASVIWRAIHSEVGLAVTLVQTRRRLLRWMIARP